MTLVTGATGFIGRHLAQRLVRDGRSVRLWVRDPQRLPSSLLQSGAAVVVGDLNDSEARHRALSGGVHQVFHCAANVHTWDRWEAYYALNVAGVRGLLEGILAHGPPFPRLIHLSTMDVYGFPLEPCDEFCTPTGGEFGYGLSKWQGEQIVRERCSAAGIPFTILRPGNVIGPGSQFITRMGKELHRGLMMTLDGGQVHAGLLFVDNLVDYLLWASEAPQALGECFNVRDPGEVTWGQFIRDFKEAIGGRGWVVNLPFGVADGLSRLSAGVLGRMFPGEPLLHPLLVRLFGRTCGHSGQKIERASGFVGSVSYPEVLARSVRWFQNECPR